MTRDDMEHAMTAAGIALIAGGLAILVGFRHLLWGSGKSRRRGRASAAAIESGVASPAATGASLAGSVESADDTVTTMQAPLLLSTVAGVPQPRASRRSRRRMAAVGAGSADSSGTDLGGAEPVSPAPSGLVSLGLADEDEELEPVSPAPTDHDPGEFLPVDVEDADYEVADYEVVDHGGADHGAADHGGADHEGADHEGADYESADFARAGLVGTEFDPVRLQAAGFDPADFEPLDPDPESPDFQPCDPEQTHSEQTNFEQVNSDQANLKQTDPGQPGAEVREPGSLDPELAEFAELGSVQFGPAEAEAVDGFAVGTAADVADDDLEPAGYAMARSRAGFNAVCFPSGYTEAAFIGPVFVGPDRAEGGSAAAEPHGRYWTPIDDHAAWRPAIDDSPWRPTPAPLTSAAAPLTSAAGPPTSAAGPLDCGDVASSVPSAPFVPATAPGHDPVAATDVPEWPPPSPAGPSGQALIRMAPEWQTPTAGWPAPDTSGVWLAGGTPRWAELHFETSTGRSQDEARVAPETASLWATPEHTPAWAAPAPEPVPADPAPAPVWPILDSASDWAASETTSGWVRGTWAASEPKGPWTPDPAELDVPQPSDEPADTAAAAEASAAAVHDPAAGQPSAESGADRTGQHFPRRTRAATVRRTVIRPDAAPAVEQPSRQRVTHPRAEARRRLAASATEVFPAVSDVTQILPTVPVIEGYGNFDGVQRDGVQRDGVQRDGRQGNGRAENGRQRDADAPARPRPRPRPRSGGQPGDDRQPARSTVYVSRHAAEPS